MRTTKLRPSPLMLITGAVLLLSGLTAPYFNLMYMRDTPELGTVDFIWYYVFCYMFMLYGMMLIILSFFGMLSDERFRGCCRPKTTLLAFLMGAAWAVECYCFINSARTLPYVQPIESYVFGLGIYVTFTVIMILAVLYITARKANFSVKGLLIDVLIMLVSFLPIYYGIEQAYRLYHEMSNGILL